MTTGPKLLTAAELAAIRERAEKATPGPWVARKYAFDGGGGVRPASGDDDGYVVQVVYVQSASPDVAVLLYHPAERLCQDGDFIAHARADVPALLSHIAALATPAPTCPHDHHKNPIRGQHAGGNALWCICPCSWCVTGCAHIPTDAGVTGGGEEEARRWREQARGLEMVVNRLEGYALDLRVHFTGRVKMLARIARALRAERDAARAEALRLKERLVNADKIADAAVAARNRADSKSLAEEVRLRTEAESLWVRAVNAEAARDRARAQVTVLQNDLARAEERETDVRRLLDRVLGCVEVTRPTGERREFECLGCHARFKVGNGLAFAHRPDCLLIEASAASRAPVKTRAGRE